MSGHDDTDPATNTDSRTDPISRVTNRVVPIGTLTRDKARAVEARMNQLQRALAALVASAENPPLQLRMSFPIPGLGEVRTGLLHDFRLSDEQTEHGRGFAMHYEYRGREGVRHVTESDQQHKALREALYGFGLSFRSASSATTHKIEMDAVIPARVTVFAPVDDDTIVITLRNVGLLGETRYAVKAVQVDRKLIDALVELVATGERSFYAQVAALPRRPSGKRSGRP